jgi:uncharacterized membrane protein
MESTSASSAPDRTTSNRVTLGLAAGVIVLAIIFAFNSAWYTHWYALFRVTHVVVAVFWVGGGLLLTVLGLRAERLDDPDEMAAVVRQAAFAGERLFAPAGGIVLAMGIAMMINTDWGWGKFWVVAGLIGYAATFITGLFVLKPLISKLDGLLETKGAAAPESKAVMDRVLLIARVDTAVLLLVVADMVTKPFS